MLNVADAFAMSAGATRLMTARVIAGTASEMPRPASATGPTVRTYGTPGEATAAIQAIATAMVAVPVTIRTRSPTRSARAPARGPTSSGTRPSGSNRSPAANGPSPFRRELHVHCYRILGSLQDAEDVLQETLVAAWRGLAGFDGRSSLRTWLYRIATNRCLNAVRDAKRRPARLFPAGIEPPPPTRTVDPLWLDPYPDAPS